RGDGRGSRVRGRRRAARGRRAAADAGRVPAAHGPGRVCSGLRRRGRWGHRVGLRPGPLGHPRVPWRRAGDGPAAMRPPSVDAGDLRIAPLSQAETIPSAWYTDADVHRLDAEAVIAAHWQYVGHESRLAEPGAYLTTSVADQPVVVVRGKDGALRAFYNVCRHRGGPLATAPCGR